MSLLRRFDNKNVEFGPPYAVLNLSKIGLRYFRLCIKASPATRQRLIDEFKNHPNIGWIFSGQGWFNLAVGVWARDNAEINDVSAALRRSLGKHDKLVYQSELTSLYGFGNQPILDKPIGPMPIIDAVMRSSSLNHLELDYIKLVTLDDSLSSHQIALILGAKESVVKNLRSKFEEQGIIVGRQKRINYAGKYFKVFIDTSTGKYETSSDRIIDKVWHDQACIYFEKANGKYDLEFELILPSRRSLRKYTKDFRDAQIATLTQNLYTNLYPLSKVANLLEIHETLKNQNGDELDFSNSKLWYLNYQAANAYLDIYRNKKYFEVMEKSELDLFESLANHIKQESPGKTYSLIDIGSGNGLKGREFIKILGENLIKAYYAIDVQPIELAAALRVHENASYASHPVLLDFEKLSARFPLKTLPGEAQLYFFLGGTYGNFQSQLINGHLKKLLKETSSRLFITMPIQHRTQNEQDTISMYSTLDIENLAFGPLQQIGFNKTDFLANPKSPKLRVHVDIEDKRVVTTFVLSRKKKLIGRVFNKGTVFKMTTSWKPSLEEFKEALETDFTIRKIISNSQMVIAEVSAS